ncbi:amino acid dehydrogenase [Burkholderia sp. Leaf177]|uniref:D-amino acid dehydrogenase n=1 Tax=Burkholderia sp. Leaf177 TaxID=1736287 RepID=UPI0006F2A0AE|nr:D-amino acid dehydrogenase [Burkholderia sp. Leaf177]KQR81804.1 amino acid dehydrogenase [Burkholderia sp. Leaf177]
MEITVLGAGVIGLTTAYYLNASGHRVTVVDRRSQVGQETSYANGAQLSYSYVAPLAGPGVVSKIPGWLLRDDSPMRFRPSADPALWRWCLQFLRACTRQKNQRSTRHLLKLSFLSRSLMHKLVVDEPTLDFDYTRSGKLVLHRDEKALASAVDLLEFQRTLGCEQLALDREACVRTEPALESIRHEIAGGIYTASEDTADCYRFCVGLEKLLRRRGVVFELSADISALKPAPGGRVEAWAGSRRLPGEQVVVATGCASAKLLKSIGIDVPVYPLKGYSLTVPIRSGDIAPCISVTDFAHKIVYARLGERLRVAGMADMTGYSDALDHRRLDVLRLESKAAFPMAGDYCAADEWAGLRPATPSGMPIVGSTPFNNLWLNVGHGALGFTLATGCAQLLNDLIAQRPTAIDCAMFKLGARS